MTDRRRKSLMTRIAEALGLKDTEIAAGHGELPEAGPRPSTQSRQRSRERQRERATGEDAEKAADAIAEAAEALDEQIRRSVSDPGAPRSSEEMVEEARRRWSSDS